MKRHVKVVACPCPSDRCPDWHLTGIGKFVQGSGFTREEADLVARLVNDHRAAEELAEAKTR